jgi:hypothetical protein
VVGSSIVADVFISFIHEEQQVAEAVQGLLRDMLPTGSVFLSSDRWQMFAGEVWLDRIRGELLSAKVVVLLLSRCSVTRPWVNFEAGAAWWLKAVVPACYGGLTKGSLPKPYSGIQALDLRDEWYYLVSSVAHHLGVPLPPPPIPGVLRPTSPAGETSIPEVLLVDPVDRLIGALDKLEPRCGT